MLRQYQDQLVDSLQFFIKATPSSTGGIMMLIDHPSLKGRLTFEPEGVLAFPAPYIKKRRLDFDQKSKQNQLVEAMKYFIENTPSVVNGFAIRVGNSWQ